MLTRMRAGIPNNLFGYSVLELDRVRGLERDRGIGTGSNKPSRASDVKHAAKQKAGYDAGYRSE